MGELGVALAAGFAAQVVEMRATPSPRCGGGMGWGVAGYGQDAPHPPPLPTRGRGGVADMARQDLHGGRHAEA